MRIVTLTDMKKGKRKTFLVLGAAFLALLFQTQPLHTMEAAQPQVTEDDIYHLENMYEYTVYKVKKAAGNFGSFDQVLASIDDLIRGVEEDSPNGFGHNQFVHFLHKLASELEGIHSEDDFNSFVSQFRGHTLGFQKEFIDFMEAQKRELERELHERHKKNIKAGTFGNLVLAPHSEDPNFAPGSPFQDLPPEIREKILGNMVEKTVQERDQQ